MDLIDNKLPKPTLSRCLEVAKTMIFHDFGGSWLEELSEICRICFENSLKKLVGSSYNLLTLYPASPAASGSGGLCRSNEPFIDKILPQKRGGYSLKYGSGIVWALVKSREVKHKLKHECKNLS